MNSNVFANASPDPEDEEEKTVTNYPKSIAVFRQIIHLRRLNTKTISSNLKEARNADITKYEAPDSIKSFKKNNVLQRQNSMRQSKHFETVLKKCSTGDKES